MVEVGLPPDWHSNTTLSWAEPTVSAGKVSPILKNNLSSSVCVFSVIRTKIIKEFDSVWIFLVNEVCLNWLFKIVS